MSYRNELCQPCGECSWCHGNWKAKRAVPALRAALRRALHQIDRMATDLEAEARLYADDDPAHPHARGLYRNAGTARRVAARLAPLTRSRRVSP